MVFCEKTQIKLSPRSIITREVKRPSIVVKVGLIPIACHKAPRIPPRKAKPRILHV